MNLGELHIEHTAKQRSEDDRVMIAKACEVRFRWASEWYVNRERVKTIVHYTFVVSRK